MNELQLSNTSYTNKQFSEIYPELLQLAKDLSYRWDPTVSNESDPGVVLIKELALVADKLNYSADKNVLEAFPLSVTQEDTSRQLYNLLGYYPKWYRSAISDVQISWVGDTYDSNTILEFPLFTQITDTDNNYVYTLIENPQINVKTREISTFKAIEGRVKRLEINGSSVITLDNLDSENKLYFPDYYVAQNGIFIYNTLLDNNSNSVINLSRWSQRDNLSIEDLNNKFYSFGIDSANSRCYIQFPDDVGSLIQNGLAIFYIVSSGAQGNVPIGILNNLLNSNNVGTITTVLNGVAIPNEINITTDDVYITNIGLYSDGEDPESIDDMYRGYKHTAGTFDTLITLRDYENALYNLNSDGMRTSNAKVCDRTNDIQKSYKIVYESDNINTKKVVQEQNDVADLEPFDLKVYAFKYSSIENQKIMYDYAFTLYDELDPNKVGGDLSDLLNELDDKKLISHNYNALEKNKICLLKNMALITCRVIPSSTTTALQKSNIKTTIANALYNKFSCHKLDFGEELDYQEVHDTILLADNRIRNIILNDIEYNTYAIYYSENGDDGTLGNGRWKSICISDETSSYINGYFHDYNFYYNYDPIGGTYSNPIPDTLRSSIYSYLDLNDGYIYKYNSEAQISSFDLYSTKRNEFRIEILAKNILAGITPAILPDGGKYPYQINQYGTLIHEVKSITTDKKYKFIFNRESYASEAFIKENEAIQFYRPSISATSSYGSYVKVSFYAPKSHVIPANRSYVLKQNERVTFFYKESNDSNMYRAVRYYPGTIIYPTLAVTFASVDPLDGFNNPFNDKSIDESGTNPPRSVYLSVEASNNIQKPATTMDNFISLGTSSSVSIQEVNSAQISSNYYMYFITNSIDSSRNEYLLTLSDNNYEYMLRSNEYLFYTDPTKQSLNILGAGTLIKAYDVISSDNLTLRCPIIDPNIITKYGIAAIDQVDGWQLVSKYINDNYDSTDPNFYVNKALKITEQEYINVVDGGSVNLELDYTALHKLLKANPEAEDETEYYSDVEFVISSKTQETLGNKIKYGCYSNQSGTSALDNYSVNGVEELLTLLCEEFTSVEVGESIGHFGIKCVKNNNSTWDLDLIYGSATYSQPVESINLTNDDFSYYCAFPSNPSTFYIIGDIDKSNDIGLGTFTKVQYRNSTDESYQTINNNTSETNLEWNILSYLNLNVSPEIPQKLTEGQRFIFNPLSGNFAIDTGILKGNEVAYVYCSDLLYRDGGENLSLSILDDNGDSYNPEFYWYKVQSSPDSNVVYDYSDNTIRINFDETGETDELIEYDLNSSIVLPQGTYILSLVNQTTDIFSSIELYRDSNKLYSYNSTNFEFKNKGTHYIKLDNSNSNSNAGKITIKVTKLAGSKASYILIKQLLRYKESDIINSFNVTSGGVTTNLVNEKINDLNTDTIYNYTYDIDDSIRIDNPLSSISFLNYNHFYNPFTICQLLAPTLIVTQ